MITRDITEASADTDARTITGRLAVYDTPTQVRDAAGPRAGRTYTEIVARGALADADTSRVKLYDRHREAIGRMTELDERADGAWATFKVSRTRQGDDSLTLARDGVLDSLSWGADPSRSSETVRADGVVVRTKLHVLEGSITDRPAYEGAVITQVRESTMDEITEAPEAPAPEPVADDVVTREYVRDTVGAVTGPMLTRFNDLLEELGDRHTPPAITGERDTPESLNLRHANLDEYLHDLYLMERGDRSQQSEAGDRIQETLERAITPTTTTNTAGAVPTVFINDLVDDIKTGAPLLSAMGADPLPPEGLTVSIPKVTTGAAIGARSAETGEFSNQAFVTAAITETIAMYGGSVGLTYEARNRTRPAMRERIVRNMGAAWMSAVEDAIINGAGTSGEITGMLVNSDIQDVDIGGTDSGDFTAATLIAAFSSALALALAASNQTPVLVAMHGRRWAAMIGLLDSTSSPLFNLAGGQQNQVGSAGGTLTGGSALGGPGQPTGNLAGYPIVVTNAIPTTASTDEDVIMMISGDAFVPMVESGAPFNLELTYPGTAVEEISIFGLLALLPTRPAGLVTITGEALGA